MNDSDIDPPPWELDDLLVLAGCAAALIVVLLTW